MLGRSQLPPKLRLGFLAAWTAFAGIFTVVTTVFFVADVRGGDATATVVHVYSQAAYTISFTTKDGVRCETTHKWDPRPEPVRTGDTFEVRYSKIAPCDNVERADDYFARFGGYFIPPIFLTVGLAAFLLVRRKTKAEARRLTLTSARRSNSPH